MPKCDFSNNLMRTHDQWQSKRGTSQTEGAAIAAIDRSRKAPQAELAEGGTAGADIVNRTGGTKRLWTRRPIMPWRDVDILFLALWIRKAESSGFLEPWTRW
jgi:hypothetical protein